MNADDEYNDYLFNDLLIELERNGTILRMFESGRIAPEILDDDDDEEIKENVLNY